MVFMAINMGFIFMVIFILASLLSNLNKRLVGKRKVLA